MKPYLVQTPKFVQRLFPKRIWAFPASENTVYLTFDDGPIPEVTPWVLDLLKKYKAKATFFCIGDNIQKHPKLFRSIISEGHAIGNHTFNHLNGRKTPINEYVDNVNKAEEVMSLESKVGSPKSEEQRQSSMLKGVEGSYNVNRKLFRPPYGKMTSDQASALYKQGYKIVMWDVLSADFDTSISEEKCLQNVLQHIAPGSVLVFHDSLKAEKNLRYVLPKVLDYISEKGWNCAPITV